MPTFTLNGEALPRGPFNVAGIKYPVSVLDLWSDAELAGVGVARVSHVQTLADWKIEKLNALALKINQITAAGYLIPSAILGVSDVRLQCRDAIDRTNWIGLNKRADSKVRASLGAQPSALPMRDMANVNRPVTYQQALDITEGLLDWASAVMARGWQLKDAITAAQTQTALNAVDLNTGWPS